MKHTFIHALPRRSAIRLSLILTLSLVTVLPPAARAYGPEGHSLVGAIADARLAGTPTATKIAKTLPGLTLAEAALIPDKIKAWDMSGPDGPHTFHLTGPNQAGLEQQLRAFWAANPPHHNNVDTKPSHHWFHYTDVPVVGGEKYADGKVGRLRWDIVQMIPYCIRVLQGQEVDNPRKITKPIALMLLAHYLGDIHQPLHVGAEYFDSSGQPFHPTPQHPGAADEGGNSLKLVLEKPSGAAHKYKLHSYWDEQAVSSALVLIRSEIRRQNPARTASIKTAEIAEYLASHEPAHWKIAASTPLKDWSTKLANEILPIAAEAHARLEFSDIKGTKLAKGTAQERPRAAGQSYSEWAGATVRTELHKAGWRLAALLDQSLK